MPPRTVTDDEMARVLARYDVGAARSVAPGGGTANANARLRTDRGDFFLKRRNPKYADPSFVAYDHALMEHLAPHRVGTPLALPSRDGARWCVVEGDVYELYPLYPGVAHDPSSLAQIASAGRALAKYHRAAEGFDRPGKAWPRYQDPAKIRAGLDALGGALVAALGADDFAYIDEQVRALEADFGDDRYDALPKTVVHGDWHPGNALFDGDACCGLYDLDWATRQPRVLDLADGLFLWAGVRDEPVDPADIVSLTQTWTPSPSRWRAFVDGYREIAPIGGGEWDALLPTVRARWLFCRIGGRTKLPAERQAAFVAQRLCEPLRALDAIGGEAWR